MLETLNKIFRGQKQQNLDCMGFNINPSLIILFNSQIRS